jgi:cell wall-associated NlpC family hydrolase
MKWRQRVSLQIVYLLVPCVFIVTPHQGHALSPERTSHLLQAARELLGVRYQFGGRLRSSGDGIDCQGLVFYALERIHKCTWRSYSVMPTKTLAWQEIGSPVAGLAPVAVTNLALDKLRAGDFVMLLSSTENPAEPAIASLDGKKMWVWHVGLYSGSGRWINADPFAGVVQEVELLRYLESVPSNYEGIFVTRMQRAPSPHRCRRHGAMAKPLLSQNVNAKPIPHAEDSHDARHCGF